MAFVWSGAEERLALWSDGGENKRGTHYRIENITPNTTEYFEFARRFQKNLRRAPGQTGGTAEEIREQQFAAFAATIENAIYFSYLKAHMKMAEAAKSLEDDELIIICEDDAVLNATADYDRLVAELKKDEAPLLISLHCGNVRKVATPEARSKRLPFLYDSERDFQEGAVFYGIPVATAFLARRAGEALEMVAGGFGAEGKWWSLDQSIGKLIRAGSAGLVRRNEFFAHGNFGSTWRRLTGAGASPTPAPTLSYSYDFSCASDCDESCSNWVSGSCGSNCSEEVAELLDSFCSLSMDNSYSLSYSLSMGDSFSYLDSYSYSFSMSFSYLDSFSFSLSFSSDWSFSFSYSLSMSYYFSTSLPTQFPTLAPSYMPTPTPTYLPTYIPTPGPTYEPSYMPTPMPTYQPSYMPTSFPTAQPTYRPTLAPSALPSYVPTLAPSATPTYAPSTLPSPYPTAIPSYSPTALPTRQPSYQPTLAPTAVPTYSPTA